MQTPSVLVAFVAGLAAFFTPCCLPIYPSFLSYVTGVSIDEISAGTRAARTRVLQHSLAFLVGFSTIYVAMGLAFSALGSFFIHNRTWLPIAGGIWVALMGLALLGVLPLPFLIGEHRVHLANKPAGYLGSALVGLAFAAGWTPCTGPILATILVLAAANPGSGGLLLLVYSIGFAVPFIALAYTLGSVRALRRYTVLVQRIGGGLMILMGVLLATGYMEKMSAWLLRATGVSGL